MTTARMAIALSLVLAACPVCLAQTSGRPVDPNGPMSVEDLVARYIADANSQYERFGQVLTAPDANRSAVLDANAVDAIMGPGRSPRPVDAADEQASRSGGKGSMREMILRLKGLSGDIEGQIRGVETPDETAASPEPDGPSTPAGARVDPNATTSAPAPLAGSEDPEIDNPYADDAPAPKRPKTIEVPSDPGPQQPRNKKFRTLPTESVRNPLHLADALYRGSYYEAAAAFYELAVKDPNTSQKDVEWAMFQWGNALRYVNPERSRTVFKQLTTEYPDSPWTTCAEIQHRTVNWEVRSRPRKLLEEFRDGSGADAGASGSRPAPVASAGLDDQAGDGADAASPSVARTPSR
jgi:hypothetical protein